MASDDENLAMQIKNAGFTFLLTDLHLALTMIGMASDPNNDSQKRTRNRNNARRAFDSVLRLSSKIALFEDERKTLQRKLDEVKSALERLGEQF